MINTIDTIKNILIEDLGLDVPKEEIGVEDGLQNVLGMDSVGFVELRFQIEQAFNIKVADEDFVQQNFKNISVLTRLIERLSKQGEVQCEQA